MSSFAAAQRAQLAIKKHDATFFINFHRNIIAEAFVKSLFFIVSDVFLLELIQQKSFSFFI